MTRCSHCGRKLTAAIVVYEGAIFGPTCAKRLGLSDAVAFRNPTHKRKARVFRSPVRQDVMPGQQDLFVEAA